MPPYVPRKRTSASPVADAPPAKRPAVSRAGQAAKTTRARQTAQHTRSVNSAKASLVQKRQTKSESDSESDSSLSETPTAKRQADKAGTLSDSEDDSDGDSEASSDAGVDWEAELEKNDTQAAETGEGATGDIRVTLDEIKEVDTTLTKRKEGKKYAPSKREKAARVASHCMHVQCLMMHNHMRNHWCEDRELQQILLDGMTDGCKKEVKRWIKACGNTLKQSAGSKSIRADNSQDTTPTNNGKGKDNNAGNKRKQRDWGADASEVEAGVPIMTHGDPSLRLLKFLSAYWKKRFRITAPGVRKLGYKDNKRIARERAALQSGQYDPELHGERIKNKSQFREAARTCRGSRDVGAQLFTALLRGVGMEARLVASLQPLGFGWTKIEEADPPKKKTAEVKLMDEQPLKSEAPGNEKLDKNKKMLGQSKEAPQPMSPIRPPRAAEAKNKSKGGTKADAIKLETSESDLSSPPASDDESIPDMSIVSPSKSTKKYDRDLAWPHYWTEIISPITQQCIAVDPMVLNVIANNQDSFVVFEPRGAKADKAKQVMAYVVAFSSDNTAKDVTVRYLKKHIWPGKTKGVRYPAEKVALRKRKGKVIRYVEKDFFGDLMALYRRPETKRTAADDMEDEYDLKAVIPDKDSGNGPEIETLQWYKNSAEFVLERHLRREEALVPNATPVKQFRTGKGDNIKSEPVFLRADVLPCRTVESWHKEGREVKENEQPLKRVPMRAVTAIRKRQIEMAEAQMGGEKMMQGLYAKYQTDWIIPPPIEDGVIPKNAYGNMDVYVPTMVPKGAIHIPLRGTAKVCRKLGIDHAEAVTGFEFGNRMAVPILTGVVVAKENENAVIDAWQADQAVQRQREAAKREKANLDMWKRFMTGLRVIERMRREYGDDGKLGDAQVQEAVNQATAKQPRGKAASANRKAKPKTQGFVELDGVLGDRATAKSTQEDHEAHGLLQDDEDEVMSDVGGAGGFIVEGEDDQDDVGTTNGTQTPSGTYRTPMSLAQLAAGEEAEGAADADPNAITIINPTDDSIVDNKKTDGGRGRNGRRGGSPRSATRGGRHKSSGKAASGNSKAEDRAVRAGKDADSASHKGSGRKAGKRSSDAVRSHYFANSDSDQDSTEALADEDLDDDDDSPPSKKARGAAGRGRGKGRGRGRGVRKTL